ncbi:MAG: tetratricopeptide repeat protein [Flavobacteriaceae bacterium]|nr:tetratricopeptide repeat protein [Flavobacteriaceae bacterium]
MNKLIYIFCFFCCFVSFSQNEELAKDYFDRGEFQKALISYQKLYEEKKGNINYFIKIVEIHQQLEQLDIAEQLLLDMVEKSRNPQHLVDLGYNYHLKNEEEKAQDYYNQALLKIDENPVYGYYVAYRFETHALIDLAAKAYERTMELRPEANYHIQLARIYGEQGAIEKMFTSYVNFVERNNSFANQVKRYFNDYISESSEDENNAILRKVLLKKIQEQPNVIWNQLLSWLFVQQRDYAKAFAQEKAIYKREQESLRGIIDLANLTLEEDMPEISADILMYLIETAIDIETIVDSHKNLLELQTKHATKEEYKAIDEKYNNVINTFENNPEIVDIKVSYAHFKAFYLNKPDEAISYLKTALEGKFNRFQLAKIKLELGDILVYQEKFNEALIYYSQIQTSLKNSTISQEARFKVAKASYYKGDFKWAESQLKILKASTSQLIANDALDLKLLISDNKFEDSTQTALKLYAKADLYAYQNKTDEAISLLDKILEEHKTESIIDQALYKQGKLFEGKKDYLKAEANYKAIIDNYREDILADDAYYALAELYVNVLNKPEEAQALYEKIIFNHADSIYFVEARKKFRALRGDEIN